MNKTERTKLKKKGTRLYVVSYSMGIFGVIFLISIFVTPMIDMVRKHLNSENIYFQTVTSILVILFTLAPMFGSLIVMNFGSMNFYKLHDAKRKLLDARNKFHIKLFWDAIQSSDFEEAKRLYNITNFIRGNERILCNGILMGIATQTPIDKDWGEKVDERMNGYLV